MVYVSNDNTPVCEYADYKFYSPAEYPDLCEAIYSYIICLLGRFMKNAGAFDKYDEFMAQYAGLTKYPIAGKEMPFKYVSENAHAGFAKSFFKLS